MSAMKINQITSIVQKVCSLNYILHMYAAGYITTALKLGFDSN